MANINKIRLSGTTYNIQDVNATKTVELTQAQYDALTVKDPNTFYIITDAEGADLSNYYTKSETSGATEISTALASKQTTLTAGTNITIVDNVISATGGGGSITIDTSLDSSSTNAVANSAITNAINAVSGAIPTTYVNSIQADTDASYQRFYRFSTPSNFNYFILRNAKINGRQVLNSGWSSDVNEYSLVETSAITTAISSSSTDAQVPSAKAVNDKLGGLSLVKLSQSEYDGLATKNNSTLYVIVN